MKRDRTPGRTLHRGEPGFDQAVLATSFSGIDPGFRPDIYVQANNAEEAARAVRNAARAGQKLAVVSGGHAWSQNHLRDGGTLLDVSRLNSISIDPAARRAVAGPGVWAVELDAALSRHRLFFPVAHAFDVALGGFLLQGGFGWASRMVGLGCENVVGLDLILADGRQLHASATENADLYWAARGAGPGFFAVVAAFHLRLHPRPGFVGVVQQVFRREHLEDVFRWADSVGPDVPRSVEFQVLMTAKATLIGGPGIEIATPVLTDDWQTARRDMRFLTASPLRRKASFATPLIPATTTLLTRFASMRLFPPRQRWSVDNMWTDAPIEELLPGLHRIIDTMPPAPTHALWLNWYPVPRPDMAFSIEANRYLACYGEWSDPRDDARLQGWAAARMAEMAHLSCGIQLADEGLARRPARFVTDRHLAKLDALRKRHDPDGMFFDYRGRPPA